MNTGFGQELEQLINKHCVENQSHTPDFVLAQYLRRCLETWNETIAERDKWWSFSPWAETYERSGLDKANAAKATYEKESNK